MKTVVGISLGKSAQDFEFTARFMGQRLAVRRLGTDGSVTRAQQLIATWRESAAAIGLGILRDAYTVGTHQFVERHSKALMAAAKGVPVTTGGRLADILQEWALRRVQASQRGFFNNARVLFFSGLTNYKLAAALSEFTPNLQFADPLLQLGVPKFLTTLRALELYGSGTHGLLEWAPSAALEFLPTREWARFVLKRALREATVVVAPVHELAQFDRDDLAGKTIITSTVSELRVRQMKRKGVATIIDGAPSMFGHELGPSMLDAMIMAVKGRSAKPLLDDDYLAIISELGIEPRIIHPAGFRRVNRFAFVIHPLSQEYFKTIKPIELLSQVSPPLFMDTLEKAMAYAPPFIYSKVSGIRSPSGVEAEGWLISVGGTPKEIMSHDPEFTYRRLLDAADMARGLGAQIMGLGAFTKVVGDAGVTVARRASLPITTGNSYSASGALWAAHDAMRRLGLVQMPSDGGKVPCKAMVVGATGAIGSACARMLAMVAAELHLVSPETAKLLSLKSSILEETPDARLFLSARADNDLADMDMVVTATSGAGKKVLDIMKVKPGCVITDVARPLDLPASEVAKRPDVLVIESGEIRMPGKVQMKNIGLPRNVAYACLAETIVLALEGRFENFTVGRNIEWEKVREIYRLGIKHGMSLAAISGVRGPFSDADIRRVRRLALKARASASSVKKPSKRLRRGTAR